MRVLALLVVASFLVAGCMESGTEQRQGTAARKMAGAVHTSIDLGTIVAQNASQVVLPGGVVRLVWEGLIGGPVRHEITIPGSVMEMRGRFTVDGTSGSLSVIEPKTGNVRCFSTTPLLNTITSSVAVTCTGVTVLDTELAHAANYSVSISGGSAASPAKYTMELELLPGPLDGPAANLDLGALPSVRYGLAKQITAYVPSSIDGARMFVEVNLPDGSGPWPTIHIGSPYNQPVRDAGQLTQGARVKDWVPRGYAVVASDVRGFANSEGCVEVWGPKEQQDQYDIVEWIAKQPWSNGKVAMYGQSYVGTTPHEAAIKQAPHLVAIATVAGLTDPYFDWHYGGVRNGESTGSPQSYSLTTDQPPKAPSNPQYVPDWFNLARTQGCDLAPMMVAANDPNALYGQFYWDRNFTAKAKDIKVPVLYTQGYIDTNVKVQEAVGFFDAIPTTKIGVFGPWVHRHPPRGDFDLLLHAWMARWLMDAPTSVETWPTAQAITNVDTVRTTDAWPPAPTDALTLYPNGQGMTMDETAPGSTWQATWVSTAGPAGSTSLYTFNSQPLGQRTYIAGVVKFAFPAKLDGGDNAHFQANLYDVDADGHALRIAFGQLNAALRDSYERYAPMPQGQFEPLLIQFLPTEYVVLPGHSLRLTFGPTLGDTSVTASQVTVSTGQAEPTRLVLPILGDPQDTPLPATVEGFEAFRTR